MKLSMSVSPHIKTSSDTASIMLDVIIALAPATVFGVLIFGFSALTVIAVCVAASVLTEALFCCLAKKPLTTGDFSAVVTGLLLALNLPAGIPLYIALLGSVFAIAVVKLLFGGLGKNLVNPAIAGRIFLLSAFTSAMTTFKEPFSDTIASATPLSGGDYAFNQIFFGVCSGSIGETSVLLLLLGGVYLLYKKIITWHIPVCFIAVCFAVAFVFGQNPFTAVSSGGIMLGAIFMATDYVTSPTTKTGKMIFGAGCGIITMFIRLGASLPEGVSYSILIMNLLTPLIDRFIVTKPLGAYTAKGE
ncbi:MAG: RnfABCDGE type electron transport complex subunit D [Acutalibacteraceae bacterium]|nr:RnfABCDGE type electron transport complex subunit D [Acutalibacteraceae bacterium]